MNWVCPLDQRTEITRNGAFGAVRKHDIHTGVDLYCDPGALVKAVEYGTVVAIEEFTGPNAGSPWWLPTQAVLVEGPSGVVLYGEIEPSVKLHDQVRDGDEIGRVKTVLKEDKGLPMTMLHLELYTKGTRKSVWWHHGEPKPVNLRDPSPYLVG